MKNKPNLYHNTATKPLCTSIPKKRTCLILLPGIFVLLTVGIAITAANFSRIKNSLILRFGSPQAYMAYVETEYLRARGMEWQEKSRAFSSLFKDVNLTGAKVDVHINHLLTSLLKKENVLDKTKDFPNISLLLLNTTKEALSLLELSAQIDESPFATLNFLSDTAADKIYIACPQAGRTALVVSTSKEELPIMLHHLLKHLQAFGTSVYSTISFDPYNFLLPYLNAITEVHMERNVRIPIPDSTLTGTRLDIHLSLDTALDIAATEFAAQKNNLRITDPLLAYYECTVELLTYLTGRYPADLLVTAYVDNKGQVLGHEFFILSEGETILSLTGILSPSPAGGLSGELTLFCALTRQPLTVLLSVSQLDFDLQTGLASGKINLSCDRISTFYFQLMFGSANRLPKLSLYVRAMGATAASLELTPTNMLPASFPDPKDYTQLYPLTELSLFLQSMDFSGILSDFSEKTGLRLSFPLGSLPFHLPLSDF